MDLQTAIEYLENFVHIKKDMLKAGREDFNNNIELINAIDSVIDGLCYYAVEIESLKLSLTKT